MDAGRALVVLANLVALLSFGALLGSIATGRGASIEILSSIKQGHFLGETASAMSARDRLAKVEVLADSLTARAGVSSGRGGLKPLIWLHVPKAGSYFETTLVHWACRGQVSEEYSLVEPSAVPVDEVPSCHFNGVYSAAKHPAYCSTEWWNNLCGAGSFGRFTSAHHPLWRPPSRLLPRVPVPSGDDKGRAFGNIAHITDMHLSHVVVLFREPRQRAISGWFHDKHDCTNATTFGQYAHCVSACQAQMLLGVGCGLRDGPGKSGLNFEPELLGLSSAQASTIYSARIRQLGFVGLTEHWELSVCLFHAMYGGDCLPVEVRSGRTGKFRTSKSYSIKDYNLLDYSTLDDDVYRVASDVFWHRVQFFGVSAETCARAICPLAADAYSML